MKFSASPAMACQSMQTSHPVNIAPQATLSQLTDTFYPLPVCHPRSHSNRPTWCIEIYIYRPEPDPLPAYWLSPTSVSEAYPVPPLYDAPARATLGEGTTYGAPHASHPFHRRFLMFSAAILAFLFSNSLLIACRRAS